MSGQSQVIGTKRPGCLEVDFGRDEVGKKEPPPQLLSAPAAEVPAPLPPLANLQGAALPPSESDDSLSHGPRRPFFDGTGRGPRATRQLRWPSLLPSLPACTRALLLRHG